MPGHGSHLGTIGRPESRAGGADSSGSPLIKPDGSASTLCKPSGRKGRSSASEKQRDLR